QYGIDNSFTKLNLPPGQGVPGVSLSSLFTFGEAGGGSGWTKEKRHQVSDNFSWTKGNHALKFGVDMNFITDDARGAVNCGGPFSYTAGNDLSSLGISCAPNLSGVDITQQADAGKRNREFCNWLIDAYRLPTQNCSSGCTATGTPTFQVTTGQHWD